MALAQRTLLPSTLALRAACTCSLLNCSESDKSRCRCVFAFVSLARLLTSLQCFSRFQTRQRYGIRGDLVQDTLFGALSLFYRWLAGLTPGLLAGAFCVPCTLIQESREIEEEELALQQGGQAPETFYRDEEVAVVGEQAV